MKLQKRKNKAQVILKLEYFKSIYLLFGARYLGLT